MQRKNNLDTTKKVRTPGKNSQVKVVKKAKTVITKPVSKQPSNNKKLKESSKEEKHRSEFESKIKRVNDLITDGCIRQAYSAIPSAEKFPEKSDVIKSMKYDLMNKIWNL